MTPDTATLVSVGETVQLTTSAQDASGNAITGKTFTWVFSDEGVATTSTSGLLTAVSNGSATITATTDGVSGSGSIEVSLPGPLRWETQLLAASFNDVWGTSSTDVFAVGGSGTILHYDGADWILQTSGTTRVLGSVWGSSSTNVLVGSGRKQLQNPVHPQSPVARRLTH